MKYKVFNINYAVEDEDVYDYINDQYGLNEEDDCSEEFLRTAKEELLASLPQVVYVDVDETEDLEEAISSAVSDQTGWLVENYQYEDIGDGKFSKEEMKKKAVEYLTQIKCYKPYLQAFKNHDIITMYEGYGGYYIDKDSEPELVKKIQEFEKDSGGLVYAVIHNIYSFGECYTMLYVSPNKEDEEYSVEPAGDGFYVFSYVWNKTNDDCSEFGTVGIKPALGGLIRVS